jgi:hypothetical protein
MGASEGRRPASGGEGPRGRTHATDHRDNDQAAFLGAVAVHGTITAAARAIGHDRDIHYRWMREDPTYPDRFKAADEQFADTLVAEAVRRARDGCERYVVSAGRLVTDADGAPLTEKQYSDALLALLLKSHRREMYGDRTAVEHSGEVRTIQGLLSDLPEGNG